MQVGVTPSAKKPKDLVLGQDEVLAWSGRPAWKALWAPIVLGILLLPAFGIGLIVIMFTIILRYSREYAITNKRVYARGGILSRSNLDTSLDRITESGVSQGWLGRRFRFGNIYLNTTGGGGLPILTGGGLGLVPGKFFFLGVSGPQEVKALLDNVREQHKTKERVVERLERLEDQLSTGQITREQYESARRQILSNLPSVAAINPPPPPPGVNVPPSNPPVTAQPTSMQGVGAATGMPQRFCVKCGAPLVAGAAFCGSCGAGIG